eukprot:4283746-Ditylum_brightwellii.AAC.1
MKEQYATLQDQMVQSFVTTCQESSQEILQQEKEACMNDLTSWYVNVKKECEKDKVERRECMEQSVQKNVMGSVQAEIKTWFIQEYSIKYTEELE